MYKYVNYCKLVLGNDNALRFWVNNVQYFNWTDSSPLTGAGGVGGYSMPSNNSISLAQLGPCDRVAPAPVAAASVQNYVLANEVDLESAGSEDDANGSGVNAYLWSRDGSQVASTRTPEWSDPGATPGSTHSYSIQVQDHHGNVSAATSFSISVPANATIDALQVGTRATGSYWGGMGEQIDLRSGNLNFSYPLVKAISRGWSIPLRLAYNSQNWRLDNAGAPWRLGQDVGFGFGWSMQVGSLTTFYSSYFAVKFYQFSDASGANYRLDQNSNGIWTSKESVYMSYDSNAQRLYFNNGTYWIFGCTSAGTEQDAGTMYPTMIEDSNGNQIDIAYAPGAGVTWINSSARISTIQDARKGVNPPSGATFSFGYNNDAIPHLTSIANAIDSQDSFAFTYNSSVTLESPFGSSGKSFGTAGLLSSATNNATGLTTGFTYDSGDAGELQQVTFPLGGHMRWQYATAAYSQTSVREVADRYLYWDATIGERSYTFSGTRDSSGAIDTTRVLTDSTAHATKTWTFNDVGSAAAGIVSSVSEGGGSQAPRVTAYSWAQNSSGNNYISRLQSTLDSGTGNAVTKQVDQTVDPYGNVTQTKLYDYTDLTHAAKTYNTSYLATANYTNLYIRNRKVGVTVTDKNGTTTTLKQNTYDQYPNGIAATANIAQQDTAEYGPSFTTRGNVYDEAVPWGSWHHNYDQTGTALWTGNDINPNHYVQQATSTATNYAAPDAITTADALNTSYGWTASLHSNAQTGPNQDTTTVLYDTADRPQTVSSPYGANTIYQYSTSAPQITATTNSHWVKTYLDGLGRVAQVQTGDSTSIKSVTDVAYDSCGCSPIGKAYKRSVPHLSGATPVWKVSVYDVLGRLTSRTRADGSSTYRYSYAGNNTTVTDPTGKWKTFTTDAYGQLVEVQEPSPNPGSEPTHETFYAYDVFGHLIEVQMSRTVGGTVRTQFRTWAYNATTLQLTSKTSPEAGTVSYTYNTDGTLATVTDANSHRKVYSYDSYGRITQIARGAVSGSTFTEDVSQRTNYAYSGTNGGFSSATAGRVSQITYTGPHGLALKEWYSYHKAGAITTKRLNVTGTPFGSSSLNLDASYGYDDEGSVLSIQYPNSQFNSNGTTVSGPGYSYGYDTMERLQSMTDKANTPWAANTSYGPSNELLSFSANGFSETRSYNANVELTELVSGSNVHYKYNYSATQDNGQILSQTDVVSGEVTTYQYDTLQRLIKASATGDPSGAWSQSYTYDGFGNLNQVAASNAPALSVAIDTTTNRIQTSASYDANGNMTGYAGSGYGYDIENRTIQASPSSGGTVLYGYDTTNHRVYKGLYNGSTYSGEEIYFYGAEGHKYGTWQVNPSSGVLLQASVTKQWFGNRLMSPQDRLDSRGKYFPFGQERTNINPPNPANDQEKFASYTRDSATGLDYADQRYYNNLIGRFMRPDPFGGSANAYVPQTWDRYAYVGNDPANNFDPEGLELVDAESDFYDDGGGGGGPVSYGQPASGQDLGYIGTTATVDSNGDVLINDPNVNPQTTVTVTPSGASFSNDVPLNDTAQQVFQ